MSLLSLSAFSQAASDSTLLGLPGDNLDLYATLDLFQKSKTIEDFEKTLNLEKTGINNLDLNADSKVDFIKVETKKDGDNYTFILQVDVSKTEKQDVAVILLTKDKDKKVTLEIVGDKDLYGKDYIVELKEERTPPVTANPAYKGADTTVVVSAPAKTTTVIVEQTPIVQYVYSPAYVPYHPPYYYGYYPPYFAAFTVMAVGMYWGHHAYHHHGYGYHGNTTVIHNTNNFNNYNRTRNTSNTVNRNINNGNYNRRDNASGRPSAGTRPSTGAGSQRPSAGTRDAARPSAGTREAGGRQGASPATRDGASRSSLPGASQNTRQSNTRQSGGNYSQQSRPSSNGASRYSGGGGASRSGGSFSGGGGSRGGGGRRR